MNKLREFRKSTNLTVRKVDNSEVFILMDKNTYQENINAIVADENKFKKIESHPTDELKHELNKLNSKQIEQATL